jgi:hypothetical protein
MSTYLKVKTQISTYLLYSQSISEYLSMSRFCHHRPHWDPQRQDALALIDKTRLPRAADALTVRHLPSAQRPPIARLLRIQSPLAGAGAVPHGVLTATPAPYRAH